MATANTFVQIGSTVTVGSGGAATIDFTSIPATYTDLVVKMSARSSDSATNWNNIKVTFNTSSANASWKALRGYNGAVVNSSASSQIEIWINFNASTANVFGNLEIYIPNYASSDYKSISADTVTEGTSSDVHVGLVAGLWSNTAAINALGFTPSSGSFLQYTTASLYGILKY
jgi:hypothetical protein